MQWSKWTCHASQSVNWFLHRQLCRAIETHLNPMWAPDRIYMSTDHSTKSVGMSFQILDEIVRVCSVFQVAWCHSWAPETWEMPERCCHRTDSPWVCWWCQPSWHIILQQWQCERPKLCIREKLKCYPPQYVCSWQYWKWWRVLGDGQLNSHSAQYLIH